MAWFKRESVALDTSGEKKVKTEGLWVKCDQCRQIIWKKDLDQNFNVCPKCDRHFRIDARTRLGYLLDDDKYEVEDNNLVSTDPLKFTDLKPYDARLKRSQQDTGLNDAVINARGKLNGKPVIVSAMEYSFIGGSMGTVVGEAITRAVEKATAEKIPLIVISASGGARMMEGVISLMQLAKISAALARMDQAKVPYISVMTDPTTGGVTASFAMLGDLEYCRARRADRICRPTRDRADHSPETAGGFPAQRVSVAARDAGRGCSPARYQGLYLALAGLHAGSCLVLPAGPLHVMLIGSSPTKRAEFPSRHITDDASAASYNRVHMKAVLVTAIGWSRSSGSARCSRAAAGSGRSHRARGSSGH